MTEHKISSAGSLKLLIRGFGNFIKNQLTVAGLNEESKNAINHNIKLKIDDIINKINEIKIEPERNEIYTITTIGENRKNKRTPAYFFDFFTAERYVTSNIGDLWEEIYDFVIIEKVPPGLYTIDGREEYWYLYDQDKNEYRAIQKPDKFRRIICWGIG